MAKVYQVIFQDEYNNLYLLGFYKELKDSLKDINDMLSTYKDDHGQTVGVLEDELFEYPSTFGSTFDKDIETECGYVSVRGFIFDKEELKKEIKDGR